MRRFPHALAALVVLVGLLAMPASASAPARPDTDPGEGKLLLLLDSSGSMQETNESGQPRIEAARSALTQVVDELPEGARVGLRVYGATVFSAQDSGACTDSQLVAPIAPVDRGHTGELKQAIDSYRPYGETPTGFGLKQAAKDLGDSGARSIVLVSDGEATCEPDPCKVAADLAAQGIDLRIDVIGLNVEGDAREQLRCIADRGRGTYYDADDSEDLVASIARMSTRAFRPFSVSGVPIQGAGDPEAAPEVRPGQYTDTIGAEGEGSDPATKYYRVPYRQGATLHLNATARPPRTDQASTDALRIRLENEQGVQCGYAGGDRVETSGGSSLLSATIVAGPGRTDSGAPGDCWNSSEFLLEVERSGDSGGSPAGGASVPIELVYAEEPPVRDLDSLPEGVSEQEVGAARVVPETSPAGQVAGGASFSDAAELEPGTVEDTLRPGELLFYKVDVAWGQSAAVTFRLKPDPAAAGIMAEGEAVNVRAYAPDRAEIATSLMPGNHESRYTGKDEQTYDFTLPQVRYQNRNSDFTAQTVSQAGTYYFAIELEQSGEEKVQVPMTISADVEGEVSEAPPYAELTNRSERDPNDGGQDSSGSSSGSTPSSEAADSSHDGPPTLLIVGAGVAAVILIGVAAFVLLRRTGAPHPPGR